LFGTLALKGWVAGKLLMIQMKSSFCAMLAVVVGILLISALPNQLSSVYSPTGFQNMERNDNNTLNESDKKPFANITGGSDSQPTIIKTWSISTLSKDANYYGLWGLSLIIAVSAYYLSKKYLY
jgi:hypothetical protein